MTEQSENTRSGLPDRQRETRVGAWVGGLALGYLLASFIVPALLPPDTIPELSGRANAFDYASKDGGWGGAGNEPHREGEKVFHDQAEHGGKFTWMELDPFSAFVYGFGDLNCHQKHERSWKINGNQMPVCTRDIGIFAGIAIAGLLFSRRGLNRWTIRDSLLSVAPDDWVADFYFRDRRALLAFGAVALLLLPVALDGGYQALTDYESNNIKRVLTGIPMGFGVGLLLSAMFAARPVAFEGGAAQVRLPASARLVLYEEDEPVAEDGDSDSDTTAEPLPEDGTSEE